MSTEDEAVAALKAEQMTEDSLAQDIAKATDEKTGKITPGKLQEILAVIGLVPDGTKRATFFAIADTSVVGAALKKLVRDAQSKAKKVSAGKKKAGGGNREEASSAIPLPFWAKKLFVYQDRAYVFGPRDDAAEYDVPLHSPLRLRSGVTFPDRKVQGDAPIRGVIVEFEDDRGNVRTLAFERAAALAPTTGKEGMIQDLVNAGVGFTREGLERFLSVVASAGGLEDGGEIYDRCGWVTPDLFITPGGEVIGETNRDVGLANRMSGVKKKGTLDDWLNATAAAFSPEVVQKAPQIPLTLLWGLVSPLADRAREPECFILALSGRTTRLKTFSLRGMASVWGTTLPNGDGNAKEVGILVTFNATTNKMMQYAIVRSGCGLAIDDSTLISGDKFGPFLYQIVTGSERGRLSDDEEGGMWRLGMVVTSEVGIQQYMDAAGFVPPPGMMSRVIELPILDGRVSDEPIETFEGAFENYGHAGPAFVGRMLDGGWDKEAIKAGIKERQAKLLNGPGVHEQGRRASRGLAFVWLAGDVAKEAGLIPAGFDVEEFCRTILDKVKGGADTASSDVAKITNRLAEDLRCGKIAIHKFTNRDIAMPTAEGSGAIAVMHFGKAHDPVFVVTAPVLAEILGPRVMVKDAAKSMDDAGILCRQQQDRMTWKSGQTGVGEVPAYVLHARPILGDEAVETLLEYWNARRGVAVPVRDRLQVIACDEVEG